MIMNSEEYFGTKAGKIWNVLKENKLLNIAQLMKKTNLTQNQLYAGLGWLAREGKITIHGKGLKMKFELRT